MTTHRVAELMIGTCLVAYCVYAIHTGHVSGKFRLYSRAEEPWKYWLTVLITLVFGVVFLLGFVSWRT